MIQPPHFLAEVAAVLAREKPDSARDDLADLRDIDWQVRDDAHTYNRALDLSIRSKRHLFDTLYHVVALDTPESVLVTADRRYYKQARQFGQILLLSDFNCGSI